MFDKNFAISHSLTMAMIDGKVTITVSKAANPLSNFQIQTCLRHLHIYLQTKSQTKSQTNCQTLKKKKKNRLAEIFCFATGMLSEEAQQAMNKL